MTNSHHSQPHRVFLFCLILSMTFVFLTTLLHPSSALAQCSSKEVGKWFNANRFNEPYSIEVKMIECGDQSLNGVETKTRYGVVVSVMQAKRTLYSRPQVEGQYEISEGVTWLVAKVPTGGYVDNMRMRTVVQDGKKRLHTVILHESLDRKPNATSDLWFTPKPPGLPSTTPCATRDCR
jgi:hypothetical protein